MSAQEVAAFAAAILFVLFVVAAGVMPLFSRIRPKGRALASKLSTLLATGNDTSRSASERAGALREAARAADSELHRVRLAARYARRALELEPDHISNLELTVELLRRARHSKTLENVLWKTLDRSQREGATFEAAFQALMTLYERDMRMPERARVLSRLRSAAP